MINQEKEKFDKLGVKRKGKDQAEGGNGYNDRSIENLDLR